PDLVRAEEGEPDRVLRLAEVRPGQRGVPTRAHDRRRAPAGTEPRLRDVLRARVDGPALPPPRRAPPAPVVHLQPLHEEGRRDGPEGRGRARHRGARRGADAADPPALAGVARGGARRDRQRAPDLIPRPERTTMSVFARPDAEIHY